MKIHELYKRLEEVAPLSLSDAYCKAFNAYDNSGILINSGKEVNGVVFSLDFSMQAVKLAIEKGYTAIVTHHPAIYASIRSIDVNDGLGQKIALCLNNGITVISMHLNLDCAEKGTDYYLMEGLGGTTAKIMDVVSLGGYGRVYQIPEVTFGEFAKNAVRTFQTQKIRAYGEEQRKVSKVASFCGAGCDDKSIAFAAAQHADVLVSADMKHHQITALQEAGICVLELTHYASENYGFMKVAHSLEKSLNVPVAYLTDDSLL